MRTNLYCIRITGSWRAVLRCLELLLLYNIDSCHLSMCGHSQTSKYLQNLNLAKTLNSLKSVSIGCLTFTASQLSPGSLSLIPRIKYTFYYGICETQDTGSRSRECADKRGLVMAESRGVMSIPRSI